MFRFTHNVCLVFMSSLLLIGSGTAVAADKEKESRGDTVLAKHMESIRDNLKQLRRTIKDAAQNKQSLELLGKVEQDTVACKAEKPAKAAQVPEAERAKFLAGYRKEMAALLQHLCKIEVALVDNDNSKAEELFKELKKIEDDGHEKYSDQ